MGTQLPPQKGAEPPPQFSAHFYCGQTTGCIKMPLGMDVGLCPWNSVLDGDPVPLPKKGRAPKFGGPFWGRGSEVPSNTKLPGPRPSSIPSDIFIHTAIWPQQIWAENWGGCAPLVRVGGSPSSIMWPGPSPTCTPNFILIRPTVWPQCTNVTDRAGQTGQTDSGLIASEHRANRFINGRPKTKMMLFIRIEQQP